MQPIIQAPRALSVIPFIVIAAIAGAAPARAQQSVPPSGAVSSGSTSIDSPRDAIEEVIVTARKMEEPLQRVPLSISAITGDELNRRSLDTLSAIGQATPNFTFGASGTGGRSASIVYIRGIGQFSPDAGFDPAVNIYIDGVLLNGFNGIDIGMLDIARIEVLRGPQGTLFGRNTSGGAVSIVTQRPDPSTDGVSGRLQVTGGSRDRLEAIGSVNLPLVADKIALRMSGSRLKQDGYGHRLDGDDSGSTDRQAGRVSLLLRPTETFNAVLTLDGTSWDESNAVYKLVAVNTAKFIPTLINAFGPGPYDERYLSTSDFSNSATGPNSSRGDTWGSSLTLDYDAGWGAIKSISAYRGYHIHDDQDPGIAPVTVADLFFLNDQQQFTQELQLSGTSLDDRLSWVLGGYYFHENLRPRGSLVILPDTIPGCGACSASDGRAFTDSYAAFGQAVYALTDTLRLTAGLRYTRDEKKAFKDNLAYPSMALLSTERSPKTRFNDVSPRLGLDYQWTPDVMTYVSVAKGYKGGRYDPLSPKADKVSDAETVRTYELGLRSELWDHHLRLNATAFYSDYRDLQMSVTGVTLDANNNPIPFRVTANIPKVRITGGELELTALPTPGLTLSSGLGITDAKYRKLPDDPFFLAGAPITLDSEFPYTPQLSLTAAAEYTRPVAQGLTVTGRLDYSYKDRIFYDVPNSPLLRQKPYGLLNARLTFEHASSGLSASLFGTNLTDEHYFTGGYNEADTPSGNLGMAYQMMAAPREVGVSVEWRF